MSDLYADNKKLIKHLKKGIEGAYIYLVNTYNKSLYVYAVSLTKDQDAAQDIVQNVFLKTWRNRKTLNSAYTIKSFLYKATYNEFVNEYRKNIAITNLEQNYIDTLNQTIEKDSTETLEKKIELVNQGVSQLPKKCKEIFLLSKKEGLSNIEIADYLNISIKTVEGQLSKAYRILRTQVGPKLDHYLFLVFGT